MKRAAEQSSAQSPNSAKRQTILASSSGAASSITFPPSTGISQEIHDRASIFKAFFLPFTSFGQVASFLTSFRKSSFCDHVDHVMIGYRFEDPESGIDQGFDDDGERFSGQKLSDLLDNMNAFGLLIVTRNYGGILLGPIRFQHITQCARESIIAFRHNRSLIGDDLNKLRRILHARDKTIQVLRDLSQRKQDIDAQDILVQGRATTSSNLTSPSNYELQTIETLKRLVTARDMTIKSLREALATRDKASTAATVAESPAVEAATTYDDSDLEYY